MTMARSDTMTPVYRTKYKRDMVHWQWYAFSDLSTWELYAIAAARIRVFIVEQASQYQDLDGFDFEAEHLVGWSGSDVAAYLRVLLPNERFAERSIGRVLTTQPFRGTGLGRGLMQRALDRHDARVPAEPLRISAQAHLDRFYASLGFVTAAAPYLEDGIPHLEMLRIGRAPA
jgi:ElaA protein